MTATASHRQHDAYFFSRELNWIVPANVMSASSSRHFDRWRRLTKSKLELAMSRPDHSLLVAELARQAGVPERTLRAAFYGSYGLSPHEYLNIQRLYQARRLLRASCHRQTTVTQIAFGLRFWIGRFAGYLPFTQRRTSF
ncbi:MAG: hypothetical protein DCF18_04935 [Cyanobium sp.]|nr:MAG: hypothetical protein DCF18_04935 [Cyanobium sp.]